MKRSPHKPVASQFGTHARRVLTRLATGGSGSLAADGSGRIGSLVVPAGLLRQLERADLILCAEGSFSLSAPGRRWLERAAVAKSTDPFQQQNRLLVRTRRQTPEGEATVTVNLGDNPLAWLVRRKLISPRQFDASERLRADYERAQRGPSLTMRWDAPPISRTARAAPDAIDPTLAQLAARQRLERAFAAAGTGLGDVLDRVVCQGHGIEAAEKLLGWPPRSAKLVLGFALDRIAECYGL